MKIVFLCSSLEPGCDGVGDYTRRLTGDLIHQGHQAAIIAIRDQHIHEKMLSKQYSGNIEILVLRLPSSWVAGRRFGEARNWIDDLEPDWISLQYVPFSFHPKGLPFGLARHLAKMGKGRWWHIMFHELWVGMNIEARGKLVWWGRIQKLLIKSMLVLLKPRVINTQANIYLEQLAALGYTGYHLPLFTNIPNHDGGEINSSNKKLPIDAGSNINLVLFGSIHPGVPACEFLEEVSTYAEKKNMNISVTIVGRAGKEKDYWAKVCGKKGFAVKLLGEQTPECISRILKNASIGISTTPVALAEKSGSIAAMAMHGLPVVCVSGSWNPRGLKSVKSLPGIFEYRIGNLETFFSGNPDSSAAYEVSEISARFVKALQAAY